jgi:hypothetical protein
MAMEADGYAYNSTLIARIRNETMGNWQASADDLM